MNRTEHILVFTATIIVLMALWFLLKKNTPNQKKSLSSRALYFLSKNCFPFCNGSHPFPCYYILLIQGNLPMFFPVFTLNYASFPYFNLLIFSYWEWPSFVFIHFLMCSYFVPQLHLWDPRDVNSILYILVWFYKIGSSFTQALSYFIFLTYKSNICFLLTIS